MKLKNLIDEVVKVPQQPDVGFDINDFINDHEPKKVATVDGHDVFEYKVDEKLYVYAIQDQHKNVSWLFGGIYDGRLEVIRTWTDTTYRNKGYATALYKALFVDLNIKISSDDKLSPESIAIWSKLSKIFPNNIKILDTSDNKILPFDDNLHSVYYNDQQYRFILESDQLSKTSQILEKWDINIPDYILYIGKDAQKFWNDQNIELL